MNPLTGKLRIELAYTDHGTSLVGSSFGIHGIVDTIDPVLESALCIGENPPPGGNELIFLGALPADVVGTRTRPAEVRDV